MNITDMIGETGPLIWLLFGLFLISLIIQLSFYLGTYTRLISHKPNEPGRSRKGVSVIICARNESSLLATNLPAILEQDYPEFEVIVVNDRSVDETEMLLAELGQKYKHLRHTTLPENNNQGRGKKLALTVGMKAARFERILLTDADCIPVGRLWLRRMTSHFSTGKDFVLGYGPYEKKKGLLNMLIRYETVLTAIQYLSSALHGKPYMGVGRNLAYHKSVFFKEGGFTKHYHLPSGDDDLFVNANARGDKTAVEIHPESHTISRPETSLGSWIRQKQRHLSAGTLYSPASRIRLGLEIISRLLFYPLVPVLCLVSSWIWPVLALSTLFLLVRMIVFKLGMIRLNEKHLLLPSLLLDPALPWILGFIWFSNIFVSKYQTWQ